MVGGAHPIRLRQGNRCEIKMEGGVGCGQHLKHSLAFALLWPLPRASCLFLGQLPDVGGVEYTQ